MVIKVDLKIYKKVLKSSHHVFITHAFLWFFEGLFTYKFLKLFATKQIFLHTITPWISEYPVFE